MNTKKVQVVMLPADIKERTPLGFQSHGCGQTLEIGRKVKEGFGQGDSFNPYYPQHLYFLSDEKIRENDWYINNNVLFIADCKFDQGNNPNQNKSNLKVIATTDSLKLYQSETLARASGFSLRTDDIFLPKPSQTFIEYYVKEYNNGKVIKWVEVEYVDKGEEDWIGDDYTGEPFWNGKLELSVNSKNEITIYRTAFLKKYYSL